MSKIRLAVLAALGFACAAMLFLLAAVAGGTTPPGVVLLAAGCLAGAGWLWFKARKVFRKSPSAKGQRS